MNWILAVLVVLAAIALFYGLYERGLLVYNAKTALLYVGTGPLGRTKNSVEARFSSCNGTTRRVICLEEGKTYRFTLSASITKGTVGVAVQGRGRGPLLTLTQEAPAASLRAEEGRRYRVVTKFVHADGEYTLRWDAV